MSHKQNIILADDEVLIRKGIKNILELENNFEVIFEANNGVELLDYLKKTTIRPDIILMDMRMPELNGIDATKKIVELYPNIKIIALSSYATETFMAKMLEVGAICFISKSDSIEEMLFSINQVVDKGFYYKEFMMQYVYNTVQKNKNSFENAELSIREKEVLFCICEQLSSTEIAKKLKISSRTVDGHRNNLLQKTGSKNIIGLVIFAIENKIYIPKNS